MQAPRQLDASLVNEGAKGGSRPPWRGQILDSNMPMLILGGSDDHTIL